MDDPGLDGRSSPEKIGLSAGRVTPSSIGWWMEGRARRFLSYYQPHLPLLVADLISAFVLSVAALGLPVLAHSLVKTAGAGQDSSPHTSVIAALMLVVVAIEALGTLFVNFQGRLIGAKIESALRSELFEHCQKLSFSFYDRERVAQLMSRITNDLLSLAELFHKGPEALTITTLKVVGVVVIMASMDKILTLMVVAALPFGVMLSVHFNRRLEKSLGESHAQVGVINERVEDSLAGIRVVKSFANEDLECLRFDADNLRLLEIRRSGYLSEACFTTAMIAMAQFITVSVILVGAVRIRQGTVAVPDLLAFLLCVGILLDPIYRAARLARLFQEGLASFRRFIEVMEIGPELADRPNAISLKQVRGELSFRGVSFAYERRKSVVLRNITLDIHAGEFVAIVGPSGAGKTTLCSLIPRFYEPSAGALFIDDVDVRDIRLRSLRESIGVVQQDVYLFAGTIADNIRYGRPHAAPSDIVQAAKRAHAHNFITAMPAGYETQVGQRGVRLSGGEKQRLTIARAFLKNPPILIFDEATSALDNVSERAVREALLELSKDRTTLVIAHRLSTVQLADRIIVLTEDGICEEGSHDSLMMRGGVYAGLFSTQ